ncbi:asparagine synthase (glutamine-hydrolyzing) [Candidatus Pelagibacter ubique]|nr:asparagine synthase (glutamine-hydrolyzing) [Candidatus Pelagibacter ubique]
MCAINGFSYHNSLLLKQMMSFCKNRGPDWEETYHDEDFSIGHNRLSILDIDNRSNQPFIYKNFILSFNGEIYNYLNLKKDLQQKGYKFNTASDTEVLVILFYEYGIEAFKKLSGIFSISIWDRNKKILYLIRDIVGIKPLYYKEKNGNIFFSSLINPLLINDKVNLNLKAANYFNNFGYNDLSETFYKGVFKVLPGELLIYRDKKLTKKKFLNYDFKTNKKLSNEFIKEKIIKIIKKQTVSDVPIALSLSGGLDSNILLGNINKPLKTYSASFIYNNNKNLDSIFAAQRATEYKTEHNEINISDDDFMNSLELINDILEEPIGNENSVGNYFLSKNIKEKVLLTGDGGDEIFTGYNKYRSIYFFSILNKIKFLKFLKPYSKNKNLNRFFFSSSNEMHLSFSNQNLLNNKDTYKHYNQIKSGEVNFNHFNKKNSDLNLENIMFADIDTWVQNDVLLRNDKIYMDKGIEVRVPYLDQEMIENFLFYSSFKKINFFKRTKPLLRKLFKSQLKTILKQKKGFNSPFNFWINEKKNIDKIKFFFSKEYYRSDLLNYEEIQKILHNKYKNSFEIYSLLMFQIFLKKNNF